MQVAFDNRLRAVQSESGCHGADDLGRLNAAVGVDDEARLRLFIHDPAARPFVVFGRCDVSGKPERRKARRAEPAPLLPKLIVAARVGQAIAIRLSLGEGRTVGDEDAADAPEDSNGGVAKRVESGIVCAHGESNLTRRLTIGTKRDAATVRSDRAVDLPPQARQHGCVLRRCGGNAIHEIGVQANGDFRHFWPPLAGTNAASRERKPVRVHILKRRGEENQVSKSQSHAAASIADGDWRVKQVSDPLLVNS